MMSAYNYDAIFSVVEHLCVIRVFVIRL